MGFNIGGALMGGLTGLFTTGNPVGAVAGAVQGGHKATSKHFRRQTVPGSHKHFVPNTPNRLRAARTCYDHIAGTLGVSICDRFEAKRWLLARGKPTT